MDRKAIIAERARLRFTTTRTIGHLRRWPTTAAAPRLFTITHGQVPSRITIRRDGLRFFASGLASARIAPTAMLTARDPLIPTTPKATARPMFTGTRRTFTTAAHAQARP